MCSYSAPIPTHYNISIILRPEKVLLQASVFLLLARVFPWRINPAHGSFFLVKERAFTYYEFIICCCA
jgi:hypothetical protein